MLWRRRRPSVFGPVVAGWASRGGAGGGGGAGRPGGVDGAGRAGGAAGGSRARRPRSAGAGEASRSAVAEAVRGLAADASRGLPEPWAQAVREAARRGGEDLPEALDAAVGRARPGRPERPGWWSAAASVQWLLMALGLAGAICLTAVLAGWLGWAWWLPPAMIAGGGLGGPLVAAACGFAARGPARRYGQTAERRLRDAAADCGRARVLEPVAAEVMRYREVREHYAVVAGAAPRPRHSHE